MRRIQFMMRTAVALTVLMLGCSLAQAQATRTWVAGIGNDADPCSRTAPCKTLAGAYSKTSVGGQINVIDASGVGGLNITHSITIDASEAYAGTLSSMGANGITVSAGSGDVVVLRGLTIYGKGEADNGISFVKGGRLQVENCVIAGFLQRGINYQSDGDTQLVVKDSIIRNNGGAGILVQPAGGGSARATIDHTRLEGNQNGLAVLDNAVVTIRDSVMAGNNVNGALVQSAPEVNIENCLMANNKDAGLKVSGDKSLARLSGSTVTANDTGLLVVSGGTIDSFGNNNIGGNLGVDGTPTNTVSKI
jgi:Right handed beta helix region